MLNKIKSFLTNDNADGQKKPTTLAGLKSLQRAVEAPEELPDNKDAQAIFDYAFYYEFNAPEEDLDLERAGYYYQKAANLGHIQAQYRLGKYYANPHRRDGINREKATFWYQKALKQGHQKAKFALAILDLKKDLEVKLSFK
ncbi:hypothetical protein CJP74_03865 [Psittacicella melopsittaci]|uniref:Sel1 repeat family protein n=1 Tax=Psittacicella melopsittaci TaxID=2028576 RepID=A0A3A1Y5U7_9GAMM|nr:SEL1-like repeat protein [Psittacicella melopsittaci]RIY32629.1 hypothetical protein CJP74_03865 [Psittacicella melopsittaci]